MKCCTLRFSDPSVAVWYVKHIISGRPCSRTGSQPGGFDSVTRWNCLVFWHRLKSTNDQRLYVRHIRLQHLIQSLESFQCNILRFNFVKWGAWYWWSLTLYCHMRKAGRIIIGKMHPRLHCRQENLPSRILKNSDIFGLEPSCKSRETDCSSHLVPNI